MFKRHNDLRADWRGAGIAGSVTDSSGALLPGAKLTLTFVASGAERTRVSGSQGEFAFLQLSTGDYRLIVEAEGFAEERQQITYQGARSGWRCRTGTTGVWSL